MSAQEVKSRNAKVSEAMIWKSMISFFNLGNLNGWSILRLRSYLLKIITITILLNVIVSRKFQIVKKLKAYISQVLVIIKPRWSISSVWQIVFNKLINFLDTPLTRIENSLIGCMESATLIKSLIRYCPSRRFKFTQLRASLHGRQGVKNWAGMFQPISLPVCWMSSNKLGGNRMPSFNTFLRRMHKNHKRN